ncbi:hypothetical protein COCHEDRAFT_1156292 [Bipolaris maydis C5]|uniref:Uncharacterized protein n=1 Tax=Cochliobolus heterostrophus (strain C5 / ATCC 48332 / race O) TaxID=701091 RepID=M2T007_COCH5|nr:hypothetical protein COCHEDRAFT_1156292 [Bipolaris maydis C5]
MDGCATMPNQHPQLPCTSARPPYLLSQQATSISSSPPPSCCARFCGLPGIPLLRPGCVSRVDMVLRGAALCRPMRKDPVTESAAIAATQNLLFIARRSTWGLPAPYLSTGPNSQSASSLPCLPRLSGFAAAVQDLGAAACTRPRQRTLPTNAHLGAGAFAQHSRSTKPVTLGVTAF